jgi:pyruvate/2-oxoglutarate dehydrogenase complex dihydrolipoamide dehydrogenase (E3) component
MQTFDFVIIGAGAAGEAAAQQARRRDASVAIVDRDLIGGSCAYWACMPSKSLLHSAAVHAAGGDYPWPKAAARRDWMINRVQRPYPDDSSRAEALETAGARVIRGEARILGPGRVEVRTADGTLELEAQNLVLALGSNTRLPAIVDLASIDPWTNREGTSADDLPASLLILGGGPTGVELAQTYVRYGVPTTIVDHNRRLLARDHPRNSALVETALVAEGINVHSGVRAIRARANAGPDGAHVIELDDGTSATGHAVLLAIGRQVPLEGMGLEALGLDVSKEHPWPADGRLRVADGLYVIGDPAGPEMHTHIAHYQGEMAVRMAFGDDVRPDYTAIPRCTYTDPEVAFVGVTLEEAQAAGRNAFELVADLATTARGELVDAIGHVTVIVDRADKVLLGVAIAGPAATETIHEAVLAIRARVPLDVLADTIHAFPTTARVMGGLFVDAARHLGLQ